MFLVVRHAFVYLATRFCDGRLGSRPEAQVRAPSDTYMFALCALGLSRQTATMASITESTAFVEPGSTVMVTGANGYIAAHVVALLLTRGYKVIGTVRNLSKRDLVLRTHKTCPNAGNLSVLVVQDISKSTDYMTALSTAGATPAAIVHLAAPFSYNISNFEEDLMIPSVAGTTAILETAEVLQGTGMQRLVHMNSFACIYDANLGPRPEYTYTERDWSPLSYDDGKNASDAPIAYRASKAVAEKRAYAFIDERHDKVTFDLVSLCPAMVFGPYINAEAVPSRVEDFGESVKIVWSVIAAGRDRPVPPTKGPVWVDVRDVAEATLKALEKRSAGGERYLLAAGTYCNQEIADEVRHLEMGQASVPVGTPGAKECDSHFGVDSSKAVKQLDLKWTSLKESLADLVPQLFSVAQCPSV